MKQEPRSFLPDPADLRWLVRSLDLRSFSAAAREMDVAVSVVARGVDRLEAGYGVRLLRRSTHGLSATPEGAELAQEARALLAQLEDIGASLSDQRSRVAGTLRLASSQEICEALVLPHLADLQARYPALRVELLADDRVADLVTEGIDVALRTTVGHSDLVVARVDCEKSPAEIEREFAFPSSAAARVAVGRALGRLAREMASLRATAEVESPRQRSK